MKFRKGTYDDVNSIYQSLSDEDKEYVTPGRRDYKDVPKNLAARQVAYDGDLPVGFVDIYGPYAESRILRMPWAKDKPNPGYYTVETAVRESHRGRVLSPEMTKRAVKKVLAQIVKNREDAKAHGFDSIPGEPDKIKWNFLSGNDKSEKAAIRAGFERKGRNRYEFAIPKEAGMAKCAKYNRTQLDYLDYLRKYKETPSRVEEYKAYPYDWTPLSDLKSQGYLDGLVKCPPKPKEFLFIPSRVPDLEKTEDESTRKLISDLALANCGFDPDNRKVYIAEDQRGRVPRSMLAHEVGHARQNFWEDFPLYKEIRGPDPKLSIYNDIESITNGVNKTDTLRCEENAWDNASGQYDPKIRELALGTYRGDTADKWRTRVMEAFEDPKSPWHLPAAHGTESTDKEYLVDPEVAEFWRTNSVPQAYNYLKTLSPGPKPKESTIIVR